MRPGLRAEKTKPVFTMLTGVSGKSKNERPTYVDVTLIHFPY